jgi:hypothetical protein
VHHQAIKVPIAERWRSPAWRDALCAIGLAVLLSACWAARDWHQLSHLILPDYDDMMRLAQVRDWLAGQHVNDWTQYRMAPPAGSPMHWSRVNDFGVAGLILLFTGLFGRTAAELIAVIAYPTILFSAHLFLAARIGRRLWGREAALVALVLGALAYPGTTVFPPGRIDHHGLQVVLLEIAVLWAMRRPGLKAGIAAGLAVGLGLVVGLEAAAQSVALVGFLFLRWAVDGARERDRLAGLAVGLAGATAPFYLFLRPTLWSSQLCDAFTPASAHGTFAAAAALGLLALGTGGLRDWRARLAVGTALGLATLIGLLYAYPSCLTGPYGAVDPFLRREFIAHIDEANPVWRQASVGRAMQLIGAMIASVAAVVWTIWRYPAAWRRWGAIVGAIAMSALIAAAQVRGTYVGTPLGAPLLAGVVLAARRTARAPVLVAAWIGCAGMGWYVVPEVGEKALSFAGERAKPYLTPVRARGLCDAPTTWSSMDRYPAGVVMAPTSVAAYLMTATHMSTVGAGYHRNDRGNMAMYRYFLSSPDQGRVIARQWRVQYVTFCPGDFRELNVARRWPASLATLLSTGRAPAHFHRLPLQGTQLRFYRIDP